MTLDRTHNISLEDMDRESVLHANTHLKAHAHGDLGDPVIVTGGKGIHITDQKGNDLIDAFAALWCVNVGYGRTEIADAIHEQAVKLAYYHSHVGHSNEPAIRLADRILRLLPGNMSKVFFGLAGSDANETNVKVVWYYNHVLGRPEKCKIIARERAYHGLTVFAAGMTGLPMYHASFGLPVGPIRHTTTPRFYRDAEPGESEEEYARRCADALDALIEAEGPQTVAAFIAEPIAGVGGIYVPPQGYWEAIQEVLDKHDVLLIADEVICGFGRMGANSGSHYYGMRPDLITVAKGLTSGYLPLAGSVVGERVWAVLENGSDEFGPFAHGFTYSAHPLCAAAGLANLDIIDREDLTGNAARAGAHLLKRLSQTLGDHPLVGEVRGDGLLAAVEFMSDRVKRIPFAPAQGVGRRIAAACRDEGLIVRPLPHADIIGYCPPLIITLEEVEDVVTRTRKAVNRVTDELIRDGTWKAR